MEIELFANIKKLKIYFLIEKREEETKHDCHR